MALTKEVLAANENLAGLTDDQVAAITTLSVNDETAVINTKIGEHHGLVEKDVLESSGIAKNEGEKSFDYMKRALTQFKTTAEGATGLQTEIDNYRTKVTDLEKAIADGSTDAVTIQKLADTQNELTTLRTQYDTDKTGWATKEKEFQGEIAGIHVSTEFAKATGALKFKAGYDKDIQKTLIESTTKGILANAKPDWIEAGGEKVMVFRDPNGEIMRNKANGLNPYTASELITEKLKSVIDAGQKKPGTGTGNPGSGAEAIELVDVAGAKTQIEADDVISQYLLQQGELKGTSSFADKQREIREKNNVAKLPLR